MNKSNLNKTGFLDEEMILIMAIILSLIITAFFIYPKIKSSNDVYTSFNEYLELKKLADEYTNNKSIPKQSFDQFLISKNNTSLYNNGNYIIKDVEPAVCNKVLFALKKEYNIENDLTCEKLSGEKSSYNIELKIFDIDKNTPFSKMVQVE